MGAVRESGVSTSFLSLGGLTIGGVYETYCLCQINMSRSRYDPPVPRLWNDTIDEHRREVREAILETTMALVSEHGLLSVTMSRIAEETGIGRATLYKYFADVEAILREWHENKIAEHLRQLAEARDRADAGDRLRTVLETYASISRESQAHRDNELAALLHGHEHVAVAEGHLRGMIRNLLSEAAEAGDVRDDVSADELATFCLHALTASAGLPSKAAVRRLVDVTLRGLQRP